MERLDAITAPVQLLEQRVGNAAIKAAAQQVIRVSGLTANQRTYVAVLVATMREVNRLHAAAAADVWP